MHEVVLFAGLIGLVSHLVLHWFEPSGKPEAVLAAIILGVSASFAAFPPSVLSVTTILASYAACLGSLSLSVIAYRISPLHPLAAYPGPVLAKFTKLRGMWVSWTGQQHIVNHALHERYGNFVRIGPNELSIVDEHAVTAVLGAGGLEKGQWYKSRSDPNAPGNLIVLTGEAHAKRRKLWNRGMSTESLKNYEIIIVKRATQLAGRLASGDMPVDLAAWFNYFTFDFMGDMAFGGGFEMLQDGSDKGGMCNVLDRFAITASVVSHVPWAAQTLQRIPFIRKNLQSLRKFAVDIATRRIKAGASTKDLWYYLSDEPGFEKEKPPVQNVVADGALAIIAGSDTTASALASLFFSLMSSPDIYARLQSEVDAVYPSGSDALDTSKHADMPFLHACINETLRLYPPVPTNGPRQTAVNGSGIAISGRFIPPGTQVYIPPYSMHRDPRYFSPSPDAFMPDRWLTVDKEPLAFIPFSFGPANCVGRILAKREMMMVASLLLQRFTFTFAPGFESSAWLTQLHDHLITTRGPLWAEIKLRT